jgi:hypothetical protein
MAISNSGVGIRPGVCTSATRPTAPYEGQMLYETDTDLTYIWGGSAWQQVSGGTAVGNSGLVYVTSVTATSGSSLNIDNVFNNTYDAYRIVIRNLSFTTPADVLIQMRASGSPAATGIYNSAGHYILWATATLNPVRAQAATYWNLLITGGGGATNIGHGSFDLYHPYKATTTAVTTQGSWAISTGYFSSFGGYINSTTLYDGITFSGGTFNSITVDVYGYRK